MKVILKVRRISRIFLRSGKSSKLIFLIILIFIGYKTKQYSRRNRNFPDQFVRKFVPYNRSISKNLPFFINVLRNQKCVHPSLDPFHPSIVNFFRHEPRKGCTRESDWIIARNGTIWISPEALQKYSRIKCRVAPIFRGDTDNSVRFGPTLNIPSKEFSSTSDFFKTSCQSINGSRYMNVHSTIAFNQTIFDRLKSIGKTSPLNRTLNILMLGFDSVSRNSWIRNLPASHSYFTKNLNGVILEGYNIVGDGTPQALLPILTGMTEEELPEARRGINGSTTVDHHPWIWKNFSRLGYVTQWGEDMAYIGTFNIRMNGFKHSPVDHYMRPYYIVTEKLHRYFQPFCLGSRRRHQIMFDYLKDFVDMYKMFPKFSFLFHSEYSHQNLNYLQLADTDFKELLKYLNENGHLESTVLILMSDHGSRFHSIRQTIQGKYEERMPYFGFLFPKWFQHTYKSEFNNLLKNARRLVTPFDIHATFKHILELIKPDINPGVREGVRNTRNLPRGISILKSIPASRSCQEANIKPHWCACLPWRYNRLDDPIIQNAVNNVVNFINSLTDLFRNLCSILAVSGIVRALTYTPSQDVHNFIGSADPDGRIPKFRNSSRHSVLSMALLQVTFKTAPNDGVYEATVFHEYNTGNFIVDDREISRTNAYGSSSDCITQVAPQLRQYCFCTF